jgi:hypothetical protein
VSKFCCSCEHWDPDPDDGDVGVCGKIEVFEVPENSSIPAAWIASGDQDSEFRTTYMFGCESWKDPEE